MACPVCKLVRLTDAMRQQPSHRTVYATQRKAASVLAAGDSSKLCTNHRDPDANINTCLIVRCWVERVALTLQTKDQP